MSDNKTKSVFSGTTHTTHTLVQGMDGGSAAALTLALGQQTQALRSEDTEYDIPEYTQIAQNHYNRRPQQGLDWDALFFLCVYTRPQND